MSRKKEIKYSGVATSPEKAAIAASSMRKQLKKKRNK